MAKWKLIKLIGVLPKIIIKIFPVWWLESIWDEKECWSQNGYSWCFVGLQYFSKRKSCKLPGFLSGIPNGFLRSNNFVVWGCWAPSLEPSGGEWPLGYSRQEEMELPPFPFCPLMCCLITALMKYLQLIMIWSNWNPFRKDKCNCYYCWMHCDSGEIGMAVWASDGSSYIG